MASPFANVRGAGDLPDRVTLLYPVTGATSPFGEPSITYAEEATVWADVEEISGREYWQGQMVAADVTLGVVIRNREGGDRQRIGSTWRVLCGDRTFEIESAVRDSTRNFQLLQCRELMP